MVLAGVPRPLDPLGFRATCYYYRKAYYRAYFFDPPACAVGEPSVHRKFGVETAFPFILNNLHRYFLYLAFIPLTFLALDALASLRYEDQFRIGLGSVVLGTNVVLLAFFTLGCNSLRHVTGGKLDCFSCTRQARTRHTMWEKVDHPQRPPLGVGVGEPHLRRRRRPLRPSARPGAHQRPGHHVLTEGVAGT